MKLKTTLIAAATIFSVGAAHSQTYPLFHVSEDIDIGDIRAAHLVHGDMWWDADSLPKCEFPKGSGKHVGFAEQISIVGKDPSNVMLVSAQNYRGKDQNKSDFWPGPIDPNASTPAQKYALNQQWARIWKVSSDEIQSFISTPSHTLGNTPAVILEWPAKGNLQAKGAGGASLDIQDDMAPFVDVDGDGRYDALSGDYPKIKGNQMLWWVFNDDGPEHSITASAPLKVEVRMSAYAYRQNNVFDLAPNIIFYEHEIVNKSNVRLSEVRLGIRNESDLGYPFDDFTGFDSSLRMGIIYNAKGYDGDGGPQSYGSQIPIMGIIMLELPGDIPNALVPVGSFGMKTNLLATPQQFWDELHFTYPNSTYGFTLNSECVQAHPMGDRRFAMASNDLTLDPGEKKKIATALVVSTPNAGGCPNTVYTGIKDVADTAIALYRENPPTTSTGPVAAKNKFHVYPNPATDLLHVMTGDAAPGNLSIFDAMGRSVSLPETRTGSRIDVNTSALPAGVYSIRYEIGGQSSTTTFVRH